MRIVGVLGLLRSLLEIHLVVPGFQCLITEKEMGIICLGCRGYSYKERSRVFFKVSRVTWTEVVGLGGGGGIVT